MPICAIDPSRAAALPVRWQSSRAIVGVSLASGFCPIICRVCWICWSGIMLRKGDCSSWTESPWRSVPSNTASPVVLVKSARMIVSLSVSAWALREKNNQPVTASPTTTIVAPVITAHRIGLRPGFNRPSDAVEAA